MKKALLKQQFKAILKVNGKNQAFSKSGDSPEAVIMLLKKEGIELSQVVSIVEFQVSNEKQRGKTARKY